MGLQNFVETVRRIFVLLVVFYLALLLYSVWNIRSRRLISFRAIELFVIGFFLILSIGLLANGTFDTARMRGLLPSFFLRTKSIYKLIRIIVIGASVLGLPVSTTHVSCGALFGIGTVTRQAHWKVMGTIVGAWVVTLPLAAALGAISFRVLVHLA